MLGETSKADSCRVRVSGVLRSLFLTEAEKTSVLRDIPEAHYIDIMQIQPLIRGDDCGGVDLSPLPQGWET